MSLALRPHVDVVVVALRSAGVVVHRGIGPSDPLTAAPYCVVYAGTTETDGPSSDLYADALTEVQVTSVGKTSEQAEWVADKAFAALVGTFPNPPPGRRWLMPGAPVGHVLTRPVTRDDDFGKGSPLFYIVQIFSLPTTPA